MGAQETKAVYKICKRDGFTQLSRVEQIFGLCRSCAAQLLPDRKNSRSRNLPNYGITAGEEDNGI